MNTTTAEIQVTIAIPSKIIANVLTTAIQQHVFGWIESLSTTLPCGPDAARAQLGVNEYNCRGALALLLPVGDGHVEIDAGEDGVHVLDSDGLKVGLAALAVKHPKIFGRILAEESDACDADALMQICLFGEIKYC